MMHEDMQMSSIQLPAEVAGLRSLSLPSLVPCLALGGGGGHAWTNRMHVGAPIPPLSLTPTVYF